MKLIPVFYLVSTILLCEEIYTQSFPYNDQFGGSQSPQYLPNGGPQTFQYQPNGGQQSPEFLPNGEPEPQQYLPNGGQQFIINGGQPYPTPPGLDGYNYQAQAPAYGNGNFPYQGIIPQIFGDQSSILLTQPDPSLFHQGQPVPPFSVNYPGNRSNGGRPVFIAGYPKPAHIPETPDTTNNEEKPKSTENNSSGKKAEKLVLTQHNIKSENKNQKANLAPKQNNPGNRNDQQNLNQALEEQLRNYLLQKYQEQVYQQKGNQRDQNAYNIQPSNNGQRYVLLQNGENYQNAFPKKQAVPQNNPGQNYFLSYDAYLKNQHQQSYINHDHTGNLGHAQGKSGALLQDVLPLPLHNQVINGKVQPLYLQRNGENPQGYYNTNNFQEAYNLYNLDRANSNIDEDSVVIDAKYHNGKDVEVISEGDEVGSTEKPVKSSLAQSQPDAVAIAGIGGVASAGPKATALAGKRGLAVASPKATAIANPTKEVDNEEIRFKL